MTPILFLAGFSVGLILTFVRHPIFGLYTYLFAFYMAPSDSWWRSDVPDIRYLLIAGVAAVLATLMLPDSPNRSKWHQTTPGRLFLLFVIYNWLQLQWAVDHDLQFEGAFLYTKHLVSFYLMYRLADSIEQIQKIAFIHVLGCAWFGYQALDAGGGRLESIGGAVSGANELGAHITTGLLFGGILLLSLDRVRRWVLFACLPLVANCLVLTISRGAFLGLFAGGISGFFVIPKIMRKSYILSGLLALLLISILAHDDLIERFTETFSAVTSEEEALDESAVSRLEIAEAGIKIGLKHPFGAGNKATELLSGPYITGWDHGRAAHNTFIGVFAEYGIPGLLLYVLTIIWVLRTLRNARRSRQRGDPRSDSIDTIFAMTGMSLVAIYVSGNFSSNIDLETQYWCLALLASASELRKSLARDSLQHPVDVHDTLVAEPHAATPKKT